MPFLLRGMIRCLQPLGKSTMECAEYMMDPILRGNAGDDLKMKPATDGDNGIYIMKEDSTGGKVTKDHTEDAMSSVWKTTCEVLKRAGIDLNV
eukprot:13577851-Ditylum_brightwellii.AAC.1